MIADSLSLRCQTSRRLCYTHTNSPEPCTSFCLSHSRRRGVLELISAGQHLITVPHGPSRQTDQLDQTQLGVFEALSVSRRRSVGEVALSAGVTVPGCLVALGRLESLALAAGDAKGWRATPRA